jgi:hypothetical protein
VSRVAIDGDTGEPTTLDDRDPLKHTFITRLDDELLTVVTRHQDQLARALGRQVSRAAAVREVLRRALPKRRVPRQALSQLSLWDHPDRARLQPEAQKIADRALDKVMRGTGR